MNQPTSEYVLAVQDLGMTFGSGANAKTAIAGVSFEMKHAELVCIVGPSGAGKTTLLKSIAGLLRPTQGRVVIGGSVVNDPPEQLAMVFQDYSRSLLPWLTVERNVTLPLRAKGISKDAARASAAEMLSAVGLGDALERYPWQLSGGMQQRVAIARGLAYQPEVLLMDEPFASLDAQTRMELEDLVLKIRREFDVTVLFVTHDIDEAVYLADRVVVLSKSPTKVQEIVAVDLPKTRNQVTTKSSAQYNELRAHIMGQIVQSSAMPETVGRVL